MATGSLFLKKYIIHLAVNAINYSFLVVTWLPSYAVPYIQAVS